MEESGPSWFDNKTRDMSHFLFSPFTWRQPRWLTKTRGKVARFRLSKRTRGGVGKSCRRIFPNLNVRFLKQGNHLRTAFLSRGPKPVLPDKRKVRSLPWSEKSYWDLSLLIDMYPKYKIAPWLDVKSNHLFSRLPPRFRPRKPLGLILSTKSGRLVTFYSMVVNHRWSTSTSVLIL